MTTRSRRALRALGTTLLAALLAACASGPVIDDSHRSGSQGPRVDLLVIHYTVLDFPTSLRVLTQQEVSSHYLVRDDPPTIYRLVDENQRSNHAGVSAWGRRVLLNPSSIGIEIVNPGYTDTPEGRRYAPYPPAQIDAVVALVRDIVRRWGIPKDRVVGHADIAPGRKQDPGPMFPWKRLADEGLALWFDESRAAALRPRYEQQLPDDDWFRTRLAQVGYHLPLAAPPPAAAASTWGPRNDTGSALGNVLVSFQMRFRPARYDGVPDAETAAILATLTRP